MIKPNLANNYDTDKLHTEIKVSDTHILHHLT